MVLPLPSFIKSLSKATTTSRLTLRTFLSCTVTQAKVAQAPQSAPFCSTWATLTTLTIVLSFTVIGDSLVARELVSLASCATSITTRPSIATKSSLPALRDCAESNSFKYPTCQVEDACHSLKSTVVEGLIFANSLLIQHRDPIVRRNME